MASELLVSKRGVDNLFESKTIFMQSVEKLKLDDVCFSVNQDSKTGREPGALNPVLLNAANASMKVMSVCCHTALRLARDHLYEGQACAE